MDGNEVAADKLIIANIDAKWEDAQEAWDDKQSEKFGEVIVELEGKLGEMGNDGRNTAEKALDVEKEVREILESC